MDFEFTVSSVGPDTLVETVTRADGTKIEAELRALAVELVSEDEGVGTLSLWLDGNRISQVGGVPSVGDKWTVTVSLQGGE